MYISYICLLPSCYIYISVSFILIIALISQYIHKKSSFSDRKSLKNILLILQDDPNHKIPILHKKLILSAKFFYIIYDASGSQPVSRTFCHRNAIRKCGNTTHCIFSIRRRCPTFSDRDNSMYRLSCGSSCTACMAFPAHWTESHRTSFQSREVSLQC